MKKSYENVIAAAIIMVEFPILVYFMLACYREDFPFPELELSPIVATETATQTPKLEREYESKGPMVYAVGKPPISEISETSELEPMDNKPVLDFPPIEPMSAEEAEAFNRDIDEMERWLNGEPISKN